MDYEIFVDSSANLPERLVREHGIHVISYYYNNAAGEEHACYTGEEDFSKTAKPFYERIRAGEEFHTSLISEARFTEILRPYLEDGKDVIVLTIASGISGTYQQACAAKEALEKQYPARKIFVQDSANASLGQGLLALRAADLRDMGESVEACAAWLKENVYKMNSYVTVDDLRYLRRSGRISMAAAVAGTILNVKPLIRADGGPVPKLAVYGRARGRKKALSALAEAFDAHVVRPEAQTIAIAHADCEEDALALAETLREHGAKEILMEYYDLCTGSHIGPGTVALFFMGEDRRSDPTAREAGRIPSSAPARNKI